MESKTPPEPPKDLSFLNTLNFGGGLKLGKGKIGVDSNNSGKADEGDFFAELEGNRAGDNEIKIPWNSIGKTVAVNIKRLRAKRLSIPGSDSLPAGKTGEATVTGIKITVSGLADMEFDIKVHVDEGKIVDIEFGDVSLLNKDAAGDYPQVRAQPAPTLKQVNPKAEKGAP
ncbi:MAG: hypothetical protein P8Y45_15605 [Exilibacterium sp.]